MAEAKKTPSAPSAEAPAKKQYVVRKGFVVHMAENVAHEAGTILELTEEEFKKFAHQLEELASSVFARQKKTSPAE